MAVIPFDHSEVMLAGRLGIVLGLNDNLTMATLKIDDDIIDLSNESPKSLVATIPDRFIGISYERREVNVFENDLRILGRKSIHSFFVTSDDPYARVFTHLSVIAADPLPYLQGPLGPAMKRVAEAPGAEYQTDLRLIKVLRHALEL